MLVLLSPAKTLDFEPSALELHSQPRLLDHSQRLIDRMQDFSVVELQKLMGVSEAIAQLNHERYRSFSPPFELANAKQAILAFKGDTYRDMGLEHYDEDDFEFAQRHVGILSGLYGLLRPLDLIQPYRLEMGTRLQTERGSNLYDFWGPRITDQINAALAAVSGDVVVHCASNEYFKSVLIERLKARVVTPVFKDYKNGVYKVISFFAKRARGMMASYIVKGRVSSVDQLEGFEGGGYVYDAAGSTPDRPLYLRRRN